MHLYSRRRRCPAPRGWACCAGTSVSFCLPFLTKPRVAALGAALLALSFLQGCDDKYSESMRYPLRTDPVIVDPKQLVIPERPDPDPPGQLPLFKLSGLDDPRNPLNLPDPDERKKLLAAFFDPSTISSENREALKAVLDKVFGTPANPTVDAAAAKGVTPEQIRTLKLDKDTLAEGSRLYRIHCLQCHGLTGDGRGPTSKWVNPHPRDYRIGIFKFQSVDQGSGRALPPRREDLHRTLRQGIEGTSMPSFNVLPNEELDVLVSYVIHLSIRGQAENEAMKRLARGQDKTPAQIRKFLEGRGLVSISGIVAAWEEAQGKPIQVAEPKTLSAEEMGESVRRGHTLFLANCANCHTDYGRQAKFKIDEWGTLVRPPNLTQAVYRGGRRPLDIYWRVHSGINGAGMNRFGETFPPEQIWDVVHFVRALPYRGMRDQYKITID